MDPPYRPQPVDAHTDHADSLSRSEQHSWISVLGIEPSPGPYAQPSNNSIPQSHYTLPSSSYSRPSNSSSLQSYYTASYAWQSSTSSQTRTYYSANSSLSYSTMNSASMWSSDMSFPYSVTSINSRKSRKNVLYPRRAHPLPVAALSENSSDDLIWQVRFLCTTLLQHVETRLVPAGRVLLQSLGLHGDFSQPIPVRINEETRCCAELFIALTHEVLLNHAISAGELEGPCKLLHVTFEVILFKSGIFSLPRRPRSRIKRV
ncbi:hypothetical protein BJY52DRAFT_102072 [Lactarius psammicola]|nr:hypothetical protein BJY52DRAFT_102072 [Lactarius psammicola]